MRQLSRREILSLAGALALPGAPSSAAAQATEPMPEDARAGRRPDLANLHSIMESIAAANAPRLSFLDPRWKSIEDWRREARPVYQAHLRYQPEPDPLGAEVLSREERDGFTVETVRIRATSAYAIPAKVLVPARRGGRVPGVVALHCHSGQYVWGQEKVVSAADDGAPLQAFRERAYGRPYAELLARRGFLVVAIDAFYFGSRRLRVEELEWSSAPGDVQGVLQTLAETEPGRAEWLRLLNRACGRYEELTAKTLFAVGATWPGLLAWDDARSVDYLCSRPEVDPARIGCLGLSLGGLRTARLIGADPRIKAACVTGWMTEFGRQIRNDLRHHTWMAYVPGLYRWLDLPDVAALTAPGALLVQQCGRDTMYPPAAMRSSIDKLARIYTKAGIPERFRGTFHDEPHSFRPAMQDEALAWLERWL